MDNINYHKSVMVKEVLQYLKPSINGLYVDATFGGGGHTEAILKAEPTCTVIAVDWDKKAIELNGPILQEQYGDRLKLIWGSFGHLTNLLNKIKVKKVNGILADFGTSQYQIRQTPGLSFSSDVLLDMRMSPAHFRITAYDIVNKASEKELATIFYEFGQESNSRKIARAIINYRKDKGPIKTALQLAQLIKSIIGGHKSKIHPATKVFQALRIVVNDELNNIKSLLSQSLDLLEDYGRIVCISFHSLEDGIVKRFFKENSKKNSDELTILTKQVVIPSAEEIYQNPSSRSAKLRAAERKPRCD